MNTISSKLKQVEREIESLGNLISVNPLNRHDRRRNESLFRKLERKRLIRVELTTRQEQPWKWN